MDEFFTAKEIYEELDIARASFHYFRNKLKICPKHIKYVNKKPKNAYTKDEKDAIVSYYRRRRR